MKLHPLALALALVLCVLLGAPRTEAAGEVVIVVHARNAQVLKTDEVKRFYMGETGYWSNNTPVHLTVRTQGSPASEGFFRAIHVSPVRFRRLWQERQLSGQGTASRWQKRWARARRASASFRSSDHPTEGPAK